MKPAWNAETLAGLPPLGPQARVLCYERIESTNDKALELLESGEPEGTLVVADEQTRGRGRRGRTWHSPPGLGLYVSLVLRPSLPAAHAPLVSVALAVAAAASIRRLGCAAVCLKWPNDLLVGERKIGGILAEARGDPARAGLVVGLGVNVNHAAADIPEALREISTSLSLTTGGSWDRVRLLGELLSEFTETYASLQRHGAPELLARFEQHLGWRRGSPLRVDAGEEIREGRFAGLGSAGELLLDTGSGGILSCRYGEVHCTRIP